MKNNKYQFLILFTCLFLISLVPTEVRAIFPADFMYGDINNDNSINSFDSIFLQRYLRGDISNFTYEYGMKAADVDGSGIIDSIDSIYMSRYVGGSISFLPIEKVDVKISSNQNKDYINIYMKTQNETLNQMCFSNDGINYTEWEEYKSKKELLINLTEGINEVIVKFKDFSGKVLEFSNSIEYASEDIFLSGKVEINKTIIANNVNVELGNVESGTEVIFSNGSELIVNGSLKVEGEYANRVLFNGDDWNGITINNGNGSLKFFEIINSNKSGLTIIGGSASIYYGEFDNNGIGLHVINTSRINSNLSVYSNNSLYGIKEDGDVDFTLHKSANVFRNNTIVDYYDSELTNINWESFYVDDHGNTNIDIESPIILVDKKRCDWQTTPVRVLVRVDDELSGIDKVNYGWSQNERETSLNKVASGNFYATLDMQGKWFLHIEATDMVGNKTNKVYGPYCYEEAL